MIAAIAFAAWIAAILVILTLEARR